MARGVSPAALAAASAGVVRPVVFLLLEFDSGNVGLWQGLDDIVVEGETYRAAGDMLGVQLPAETGDLSASPMTVTLSGVTEAWRARALAEDWRNRPITARLAFCDVEGAIIVPPFIVTRGLMQPPTIGPKGDPTITVQAESRLILMGRPITRLNTSEEHKRTHPDDTFFDNVPGIADRTQRWGE